MKISLIFFFLLIFNSYTTAAVDGSAEGILKGASAMPQPRMLDYGFDPTKYRVLRGERLYEEDILQLMSRLTALISSAPKSLHENQDFINIRGHIADSYLALLNYAVYITGRPEYPITKMNTLESVFSQPGVDRAIHNILRVYPQINHLVGSVYNFELERPDFDGTVYIGRNPFLDRLTVLLNILLNPSYHSESIARATTRITLSLQQRYHYYRVINPLQKILKHLESITDGEPGVDTTLGKLSQLKDLIYCDISFRYGLGDGGFFPKTLIENRKHFPWGLLSTLGAAAHWSLGATNPTYPTRIIIKQALRDIKEDLKNIKVSLKSLLDAEHASYHQREMPIVANSNHPHIKKFVDWYIAQSGLGMIAAHTETFQEDWLHYDEPDYVLPDVPLLKAYALGRCAEYKRAQLREKHEFLKSLKRPYTLSYLLMAGEMSKRLVKIFHREDRKQLIVALEQLKDLRDHIVHTSQKEGLLAFETRLNTIKNEDWEALVQSYIAATGSLAALQECAKLDWHALKREDSLEAFFPVSSPAEKDVYTNLYTNLFKLNNFISNGEWLGPAEMPKAIFDASIQAFKDTLEERKRSSIVADSFLSFSDTQRSKCKSRLGKFSPVQEEKWAELCKSADSFNKAKQITKEVTGLKRSNKDIILENLNSLLKYLERVEVVKQTETARFLSPIEAGLLEYYLILSRDSGNYICDHLKEYINLSSKSPETIELWNLAINMIESFRTVTTSIINPKAHLHRFSEPRFNAVHYQSIHMSLRDNNQFIKAIKTITRLITEKADIDSGMEASLSPPKVILKPSAHPACSSGSSLTDLILPITPHLPLVSDSALEEVKAQAATLYGREPGFLGVLDDVMITTEGKRFIRIRLDGSRGDCCFHALNIPREDLIKRIGEFIKTCESDLLKEGMTERIDVGSSLRHSSDILLTTAITKDSKSLKGHDLNSWKQIMLERLNGLLSPAELGQLILNFDALIDEQLKELADWDIFYANTLNIQKLVSKASMDISKLINYKEFVFKYCEDLRKKVENLPLLADIKNYLKEVGMLDAEDNLLRPIHADDLNFTKLLADRETKYKEQKKKRPRSKRKNNSKKQKMRKLSAEILKLKRLTGIQEKDKIYIKHMYEFAKATAERKKEIVEHFYLTNHEWLDPAAIIHLGPILGFKAKLYKQEKPSEPLRLDASTPNVDELGGPDCRQIVYVDNNHYDLLHPIL